MFVIVEIISSVGFVARFLELFNQFTSNLSWVTGFAKTANFGFDQFSRASPHGSDMHVYCDFV
jgi:hypothetical protein